MLLQNYVSAVLYTVLNMLYLFDIQNKDNIIKKVKKFKNCTISVINFVNDSTTALCCACHENEKSNIFHYSLINTTTKGTDEIIMLLFIW